MIGTHRSSTTAALILCLLGTPLSGTLFASDEAAASHAESPSAGTAVTGEPLPGTAEFVESFVERSPLTLDVRALAGGSPADVVGARAAHDTFPLTPEEGSAFAQRGGRGGFRGRRHGAAAAMFLGAAAAIAGTAVLVYANRPECSTSPTATGCGYGTKVVGGAVLSAGIVGLVIGALTWR